MIAKNVCWIIILLARFGTILKAKQGQRIFMNTRLSVLLCFILISLKKPHTATTERVFNSGMVFIQKADARDRRDLSD